MSGSVALSLVWLCLFAVHACNARSFGPNGGRNPSNPIQQLGKDIEIRNLRHREENSADIIMERIHDEELKDLRKQQVIGEVNSGQEGSAARPFRSYQHNADAKPEASGISKARSMVESANSDHNEEAIDSGELEDDAKGDMVVVDYAQPHRKPPIHNKEP